MDKSLHQQQEAQTKQAGRPSVRLEVFQHILNWLARLFQLTEEEQRDARLYLGDQRDK